uniref:Dynein axonemal intermediate chain 4 n=1 Tax=Hippocampus comes TaxID=109280 RepID=A0A3Q2Y0T5_HIPCM
MNLYGKPVQKDGESKLVHLQTLQTGTKKKRNSLEHSTGEQDGNDVTPRPLYEPEPKDPHAKPQRSFFDDYYSRWDTSKSSSFSIVPSSGISTRASLASQSGVGFSKLDTSQPLGCYFLTIRRDGKRTNIVTCFPPFPETARQVVSQQTPEEIPLDEVLSIYMTETDTIILLDLPSTCMSEEAENAQSNILYIELCNNRLGNDKYVERAMQTFVGAAKHKKVQSEKIVMHDQEQCFLMYHSKEMGDFVFDSL